MSSVVQLKRKPAPQMQCLGCGEISDAPCECGVGWKAIVDELQEREAERKARHRDAAREHARRKRQENQDPVDINNVGNVDPPKPAAQPKHELPAPAEPKRAKSRKAPPSFEQHLEVAFLGIEDSILDVALTAEQEGRLPELLRRVRKFLDKLEAETPEWLAKYGSAPASSAMASAVDPDPEAALRERAKRLGYQVLKRGAYFMLAGNGTSSDLDIAGANEWLDSIEEIAP
jgi:hypothetical protein